MRELYRKPERPLEVESYESHYPSKESPTEGAQDPGVVKSKKTESKRTARANREQAERRGDRDIARKEPRKSKGHSSRGRSRRTSRKAAEAISFRRCQS